MFNNIERVKISSIEYIVFASALAVRICHILEISSYARPYYLDIINDAWIYDKWGMEIAAGNVIGKDVFYQDPLYPYLLGLIYSVFGHNLFAVILIQSLIGSLTSVLVFLIGAKVINKAIGFFAAMIWATYPPIVFHEGLIMKEGLVVFLVTFVIYMLLLAKDSGYYRYWFLGGIAVGLSALTRGNILLLIPFVLLWAVLEFRSTFVKTFFLFIAGLLIVLLPIAVRNKFVGGQFVLTTAQAGQNFYWGNNEEVVGSFLPGPSFARMDPQYEREDFYNEAVRRAGKAMNASEVSRFWFKEGIDFIVKNPGHYAWLEYQKVLLLFNKTEISDNYSYYYYKGFSTVLSFSPVNSWLIIALGLLGMVFAFGNRDRFSLLYIFIISYSLSVILFLSTCAIAFQSCHSYQYLPHIRYTGDGKR